MIIVECATVKRKPYYLPQEITISPEPCTCSETLKQRILNRDVNAIVRRRLHIRIPQIVPNV